MYRKSGERAPDAPREHTFVAEERKGWLWHRKDRVVLRVEGETLTVVTNGQTRIAVGLASIIEVQIDSKNERETHTVGTDPADDSASTGMTVTTEVEQSRVELVLDDERVVPLHDIRAGYRETNEAFRQVRLFLRKHGWLPEDERD